MADESEVLIVGAGAAGLAAARELSHNWAADPFSLGACSYISVDGFKAQAVLAKPAELLIRD